MASKGMVKVAVWATILGGWLAVGLVVPLNAYAATYDNAGDISQSAAGMSDDEISSFGCVAGSVGMFAAGYWAGPAEAIMLWGGGLLTPSNSAVLAVSILGGLSYAGCSFGATIAPTLAWVYEQTGVHNIITRNYTNTAGTGTTASAIGATSN